jgi:hypothetical protein
MDAVLSNVRPSNRTGTELALIRGKFLEGAASMKAVIVCGTAVALMLGAGEAQAKGCMKGAVVGGVVGHVAGKHGVAGAAAGCAIGHHEAKKKQRAASQAAAAQPASSTSQ